MNDLLAWLTTLPAPLLYGVLALAALAENVFPPLPADTVIALGAFVAARGAGTAVGVWAATMVGNIGGAMLMFGLGRRYGLPWLRRRFPSLVPEGATDRLTARFAKQGIVAVAVSRFVPGVRAVVPPLAGAMGLGVIRSAVAMAVASGVWYGLVCVIAFRAGANADVVLSRIAANQRTLGVVAAVLVITAVGILWQRRGRHRP
ncbi:MAG: DedA family protein [Gemmatimonadota bacterium]|nr:DedA family protein [Gemmatimonadota bacterium]